MLQFRIHHLIWLKMNTNWIVSPCELCIQKQGILYHEIFSSIIWILSWKGMQYLGIEWEKRKLYKRRSPTLAQGTQKSPVHYLGVLKNFKCGLCSHLSQILHYFSNKVLRFLEKRISNLDLSAIIILSNIQYF